MQEGPLVEPTDIVETDPKDAQIAELAAEVARLNDQLLRTMAEAQNVQRRMRAQMEEDRKFAALPAIERVLPVLDSFERSSAAFANQPGSERFADGVAAIERQLRQAIESLGLERIATVGHPYDPQVHEALIVHESEDVQTETVTDEIEAGYILNGRVVRPARVRVARRP